jgi:hypothetical protein
LMRRCKRVHETSSWSQNMFCIMSVRLMIYVIRRRSTACLKTT